MAKKKKYKAPDLKDVKIENVEIGLDLFHLQVFLFLEIFHPKKKQ